MDYREERLEKFINDECLFLRKYKNQQKNKRNSIGSKVAGGFAGILAGISMVCGVIGFGALVLQFADFAFSLWGFGLIVFIISMVLAGGLDTKDKIIKKKDGDLVLPECLQHHEKFMNEMRNEIRTKEASLKNKLKQTKDLTEKFKQL